MDGSVSRAVLAALALIGMLVVIATWHPTKPLEARARIRGECAGEVRP